MLRTNREQQGRAQFDRAQKKVSPRGGRRSRDWRHAWGTFCRGRLDPTKVRKQ